MRRLLIAIVLLFAAGPALADDTALNALVADYESYALSQEPITAGREGDRKALAKLPDVSPGADVLRKSFLEEFRDRLKAIDPADLSSDAKLNRDFLSWTLDRRLQSLAFDEARLPFNSDGGFDQDMAYLSSTTHLDSEADALAWIARLKALPRYYTLNIENARRGVRTGFTQPRATVEAVLARAKAASAVPVENDALLKPFDGAKIEPDRLVELAQQAAFVIRDQIRPAQRDFAVFVEKEYLPASRKALAARSLPDGEAYYRWLVRDSTTTDLTPEQIHAIGVSEVARIRAEMTTAMTDAGWKGDLPSFIAMLRKDPKFYATSRQDLLEKASEIAKRIDDQLPRWFATLPRLTYGVRPVPAEIEDTYTTGRYFGGSPKQGIAGGYMVNTSHLDQRALYELPALTLHEAVPGHHIQIALAQELEGVPAFRRNGDVTAFTEGWGLYSEKLGGEMGIYRDPYERFGRLSYEMWRACRLVADTGIHWMGWTLPQARTCFTDNTALSPLNIEVELARYVSWPGQALAYKIGELKIVELRTRAQKALGSKFDIRRFHDAVLLAGPLPLNLLEQRIDAWIAVEAARPAAQTAMSATDKARNASATEPATVENFTLADQNLQSHELHGLAGASAVVIVTTSNGCPIARAATPALKALRDTYAAKGVTFLLLDSALQDSREAVAAEAKDYGQDIPILMDRDQRVGEQMGVVRTAELFIISPKTWQVLYRGPIDDRADYGVQKASSHAFAADALDAVLAGKPAPAATTASKGCLIDFPKRAKAARAKAS